MERRHLGGAVMGGSEVLGGAFLGRSEALGGAELQLCIISPPHSPASAAEVKMPAALSILRR